MTSEALKPWSPGEAGRGLFVPAGRVSSEAGKGVLVGTTTVGDDSYELYEYTLLHPTEYDPYVPWGPEQVLEMLQLRDEEGLNWFDIGEDGTVRDPTPWSESETVAAALRIDSRLKERNKFAEEFWSFGE